MPTVTNSVPLGAVAFGWNTYEVNDAELGAMKPKELEGIDGAVVLPTIDMMPACVPSEVAVTPELADTDVNAPVLGVTPPIAPGLGREEVDPPSETGVPPIVMAELARSAFGIAL